MLNEEQFFIKISLDGVLGIRTQGGRIVYHGRRRRIHRAMAAPLYEEQLYSFGEIQTRQTRGRPYPPWWVSSVWSNCSTVGRAVDSDTCDLQFKSNHRRFCLPKTSTKIVDHKCRKLLLCQLCHNYGSKADTFCVFTSKGLSCITCSVTRLGKILKIVGQFLKAFSVFVKALNLHWQIFYTIGQILKICLSSGHTAHMCPV